MRTILIVLVLIVVGGAVLGFSRGWFHLSSRSSPGNADITVSVDKDKMAADKDKVVDKAQDLGHTAENKLDATTQKAAE